MSNRIAIWMIDNLLTESQLDVIPPGETKSLRDLVPTLQERDLHDSWAGDVDRQSGAFSQDEISRSRDGWR